MQKKISKRTLGWLAAGEGKKIEYKRHIDGLTIDDLIAFANSDAGGVILIGVDEDKVEAGKTVGIVVGCDVSDSARLKVHNLAAECVPPIQMKMTTEWEGEKPILIVNVPSSIFRPHSSRGGIYKVRGDGRNLPLLPSQLLAIFVEREEEMFREKFQKASEELEEGMGHIQQRMDQVSDGVGNLEVAIERKLTSIIDNIWGAEMEAEEASNRVSALAGLLSEANRGVGFNRDRLKAIIDSSDINDPVKTAVAKALKEKIETRFKSDKKLSEKIARAGNLSLNLTPDERRELSDDEIHKLVVELLEDF